MQLLPGLRCSLRVLRHVGTRLLRRCRSPSCQCVPELLAITVFHLMGHVPAWDALLIKHRVRWRGHPWQRALPLRHIRERKNVQRLASCRRESCAAACTSSISWPACLRVAALSPKAWKDDPTPEVTSEGTRKEEDAPASASLITATPPFVVVTSRRSARLSALMRSFSAARAEYAARTCRLPRPPAVRELLAPLAAEFGLFERRMGDVRAPTAKLSPWKA